MIFLTKSIPVSKGPTASLVLTSATTEAMIAEGCLER